MCSAAALATVLLSIIASFFGYWLAALLGGVSLAVSYEFLQKYLGSGEFSYEDMLAGGIGSAAVALLVAIIELS